MKKILIGLLVVISLPCLATVKDYCHVDYFDKEGKFCAGSSDIEENIIGCIESAKEVLNMNKGNITRAKITYKSDKETGIMNIKF